MWAALASLLIVQPVTAQEEYVIVLRNGMRLGPGVSWETDSISTNAFQQGGQSGQTQNKGIGVMDDGLRLTYYNTSRRNLLDVQKSTAARLEQIELPSSEEVARSGDSPTLLGILGITRFNKYGRRTYSFMTSRGQVDVLQGITLLTPKYAKVEVLRAKTDKFVWDQRIAISSIPADQLREILYQALDLTKANEWLRLTKFYLEAERYSEARDTIAEALQRFPTELADRQGVLAQTEQLLANQKFEEIKLRRAAGQQQLAAQLLSVFPDAALPLETQVKLSEEIDAVKQQVLLISQITAALQKSVSLLPEPDQQVVAALLQELVDEVNFDSAVRLADYQRLRGDDSIPNENLVALALGGWMLGPGAGVQNFAVAKSLIRVRGLVREYLNEASEPRRQQILQELSGEEGAQPAFIAKLLATMKPPQDLPPHQEQDPPGFYRLSALSGGQPINYVVQLPPEYDPNRKYPCVLALHGKSEPASIEVEWWCGINIEMPQGEFRFGPATRYGYIVIAPEWMDPQQPEYQYTEAEHARILAAFRDAQRHLSVDTDRVFIAGHFDGATAAWDIAQAHPELWAGAIMISPGADKYILHYDANVRALNTSPDEIPLGTYIVFGQNDGTRFQNKLGTVGTRYLSDANYDSMVVEYRGRGRERFLSELPRIMEWMNLSSHRRVRTPRSIQAVTMRPGDRFFYWLEAPQVLPKASGNPFQFDPAGKATFEAALLDAAINGIRISSIPSLNRDAIIWLTPDMVDFSRPVTVLLRNDRSPHSLTPDLGVMLEDARRRADRMHVYWQRIVVP